MSISQPIDQITQPEHITREELGATLAYWQGVKLFWEGRVAYWEGEKTKPKRLSPSGEEIELERCLALAQDASDRAQGWIERTQSTLEALTITQRNIEQ